MVPPAQFRADDGQCGSYQLALVGLVPTNALILTGLATFRVVGNPETIADLQSLLE